MFGALLGTLQQHRKEEAETHAEVNAKRAEVIKKVTVRARNASFEERDKLEATLKEVQAKWDALCDDLEEAEEAEQVRRRARHDGCSVAAPADKNLADTGFRLTRAEPRLFWLPRDPSSTTPNGAVTLGEAEAREPSESDDAGGSIGAAERADAMDALV